MMFGLLEGPETKLHAEGIVTASVSEVVERRRALSLTGIFICA
jgi:hypothetical protein